MVDFPPQKARLASFNFILGFIIGFFSNFDPKCDGAMHQNTECQ